ncbi:MAG: hypothetical protein ACRD44_19505 [Bryobacteraceae bacterium]
MIPAGLLAATLLTQTTPADWRIDRDHPRLLLPARRLRLVQRERERESIRWQQYVTVMSSAGEPPEKGFTYALFGVAGGGQEFSKKAVEWALATGDDLRQLAIVFDWCQSAMTDKQRQAFEAKLRQGIDRWKDASPLATLRSRLMAAVTLAGHADGVVEPVARHVVEQWWRKETLPELRAGRPVIEQQDFYALFEILHVLRDNYDIDLREDYPKYFTLMPAYHLLAHYPAPFPAAENDYRVPVMKKHAEPDRRAAVLSRAAALSMVAYDANNLENQFLQGWLIQDRFLMRSPLGIPYEFLWANPYQPGLSYFHMPRIFHDPVSGRLLLRSSWEDDAVWFYQAEGQKQFFRNARIENLPPELAEPLAVGAATLLPAKTPVKFRVASEDKVAFYLLGLAPRHKYDVEVDDEEVREAVTDAGGTLELLFPEQRKAMVRVK